MLKEGTRIRLTRMGDDPNPIPEGTEGTVRSVSNFPDGTGWMQISMKWDNGRTLSLICPPDTYEVIEDVHAPQV